MRQLFAISLAICLAAPFAGLWSWFQWQKTQVRKEVRNNVFKHPDAHGLVLLKFSRVESESQLKWEHSHEFEFRGQMYDILETREDGDTVFYLCWPDHKETALNAHINDFLKTSAGQDRQNHDKKTRFSDFFKTLYHYKGIEAIARSRLHTLKPNSICPLLHTSLHSPPPTPPPEIAVM